MVQLAARRFGRLALGAATLFLVVLGLARILSTLAGGERRDRFFCHLLFPDVQGLKAGSRVVHRGMTVGEVAELGLDPQAGRVRALLGLEPEAAALVRTTTQFWVVRPRLGLISRELSGLDTLVKESYLRLRLRPGGEPLPPGGELLGLTGPPLDLAEEDLEVLAVGDLRARVLVPRNHGLAPGSPVVFRGLAVGEVRGVGLVDGGRGVLLAFAVKRAHRETVREGSRFWITRPVVRGNLLTGAAVEDLGAVLSPALAYDSPGGGAGGPAPDDALFTGLAEPPAEAETWRPEGIDPARAPALVRRLDPEAGPAAPWVRVLYHAVDRNTLRADTPLKAEGEGVLYRRGEELLAVTGRSACDGSWLCEGAWYDRLRLGEERIRVVLADGRVLPAGRAWVDPDEDLAVLRIQAPAEALGIALPGWGEYLGFAGEAAAPEGPAPPGPVLLKAAGKALGLLGQARADAAVRRAVPFSRLPADWRP